MNNREIRKANIQLREATKRMRRITREAARKLWADGCPVSSIARELGVSYYTIDGMARNHRDEFKPRRARTRLSDEQLSRIREMHAGGSTLISMAQEVGCSQHTVGRALQIIEDDGAPLPNTGAALLVDGLESE